MDSRNINSNRDFNEVFASDHNDSTPNNQKQSEKLFKVRTVAPVTTNYKAASYDKYVDPSNTTVHDYNVRATEQEEVVPSIRTEKKQFKYKLTESQLNTKVKKFINYCERGYCVVIYFTGSQTSALLVWDPDKKQPVYTTFNSEGVVVDSGNNLNSLRKDILVCSDSNSKIKKVRVRGLNSQAILKKAKEGNNSTFDVYTNNSAQYIARLLKVNFPNVPFVKDTPEQMSIDTHSLAGEIRQFIKKSKKEDLDNKIKVNNRPVSNTKDVNQHLWEGKDKILYGQNSSGQENHRDEFLSSNIGKPLNLSINVLKKVTNADTARNALTTLFEEESYRQMFIENDYRVSRNGVLIFIEHYKKAIALEAKETPARDARHQEKRDNKK